MVVTQRQVGARLARLRKRAGLTQAVVAERLNVSSETISRLERGVHWTDFRVLASMASLYGVELADLMAVYPEEEGGSRRAVVRELVDMLEKAPLHHLHTARDVLRILFRQRRSGTDRED